jgi:hypothetical protein
VSELAELRRQRDRLERLIDQLHHKHDAAQTTARHAVNALTQAEGDLQEVLLKIGRRKP